MENLDNKKEVETKTPTPVPPAKKKNFSVALRLILMGFLTLLLLIPTAMLWWLNQERSDRNNEAIRSIKESWAQEQLLVGPILQVPYTQTTYHKEWNNKLQRYEDLNSAETKYAYILPDQLKFDANLNPDVRYRSIFKTPVYEANLILSGKFNPIEISKITDYNNVQWDKIKLVMSLTDLKGLRDEAKLKFDDKNLILEQGEDFTSKSDSYSQTQREALNVNLERFSPLTEHSFQIQLQLAGSQSLKISPVGKQNNISINSTWPHPNFIGNSLPSVHNITKEGFNAEWKVTDKGRSFPQQFNSNTSVSFEKDAFGVALMFPVDIYQLNTRSLKYANLFIFLTFTCFFIFEVLKKLKIHPVQYLLVGFSLCVFYLLLLSLSEHIGFNIAYLLASISVVVLISSYVKSIVKSRGQSILIGTILSSLYAYLFTLLRAEDLALLLGSIGLFIILALVMYLTRKIDWYGLDQGQQVQV